MFDYFLIEFSKLLIGCLLLGIATYLFDRNKLIASLAGLLAMLFFTQVTFARPSDCSEAQTQCKQLIGDGQVCIYGRDASGACILGKSWTGSKCQIKDMSDSEQYYSSVEVCSLDYEGASFWKCGAAYNNATFECKPQVLRCSVPEEKVGTDKWGNDQCTCPSGTSPYTSAYKPLTDGGPNAKLLKEGYVGQCRSESSSGVTEPDAPMSMFCCVSDTSCADGFKRDSTLGTCVPDYQSMHCGAGEWKVTNPATGNASGCSNKTTNSQLSTCAVHNTLVSSGSASGSCSDYMGSQGLAAQGLKGRCQPDSNGGAECCVSNDPDAVARNHPPDNDGYGNCGQGQPFFTTEYKDKATGLMTPVERTLHSLQDMKDRGLDSTYRCRCSAGTKNKKDAPPDASGISISTAAFRDIIAECDYTNYNPSIPPADTEETGNFPFTDSPSLATDFPFDPTGNGACGHGQTYVTEGDASTRSMNCTCGGRGTNRGTVTEIVGGKTQVIPSAVCDYSGLASPTPIPDLPTDENPPLDSSNPSDPSNPDMTYPQIPPYYSCKSVGQSVGGISTGGEMTCTRSTDGATGTKYCAEQTDSRTGETKLVCYGGDAIAKAANTGCSGDGTAYFVGGRWQCSSTPPPINDYSNPEQGCPAGTVQTSVCSDWQCLPPSYRLPANLDCKAPVSTTGTGSTGSNTGTGSSSNGTSTTTTTTTSADGKTTTITNTTNVDTKGLQQDSTGKQTNQLLSSISGKQNAIADNTAKSAASDAQTASNTSKISGDTSKMAGSLSNIDSKLGGTGKTFSKTSMPSSGDGKLYKTAYPDGLSGIWDKRKAEIMDTSIMKSLIPDIGFLPTSGKCPVFIIPQLKLGDTEVVTRKDFFEDYCWVFDVFRALIIIGAIIYARKIILGV